MRPSGPDLYYYEVVECGRRILLTEVLIFVAPNTSMQAAIACIFAFVSLLGFELMRPHADPADSWLYRLVSCRNECTHLQGAGFRGVSPLFPRKVSLDAGSLASCSVSIRVTRK